MIFKQKANPYILFLGITLGSKSCQNSSGGKITVGTKNKLIEHVYVKQHNSLSIDSKVDVQEILRGEQQASVRNRLKVKLVKPEEDKVAKKTRRTVFQDQINATQSQQTLNNTLTSGISNKQCYEASKDRQCVPYQFIKQIDKSERVEMKWNQSDDNSILLQKIGDALPLPHQDLAYLWESIIPLYSALVKQSKRGLLSLDILAACSKLHTILKDYNIHDRYWYATVLGEESANGLDVVLREHNRDNVVLVNMVEQQPIYNKKGIEGLTHKEDGMHRMACGKTVTPSDARNSNDGCSRFADYYLCREKQEKQSMKDKAALREKEQALQTNQQQVDKLQEQEDEIIFQAKIIQDLAINVQEEKKKARELREMLKDKTKNIEELNSFLRECNLYREKQEKQSMKDKATLREKEQVLREKEQALREAAQALREKEQVLQVKNKIIRDQEENIKKRDEELDDARPMINFYGKELEKSNVKRNQLIKYYSKKIDDQKEYIRECEERIRHQQEDFDDCKAELKRFKKQCNAEFLQYDQKIDELQKALQEAEKKKADCDRPQKWAQECSVLSKQEKQSCRCSDDGFCSHLDGRICKGLNESNIILQGGHDTTQDENDISQDRRAISLGPHDTIEDDSGSKWERSINSQKKRYNRSTKERSVFGAIHN